MSDKDLARLWGEMKKSGAKSAGTDEKSPEAMLAAIARGIERENQDCPEPPADLQRRIMSDINSEKPAFLQKLLEWRVALIPLAATASIVIAAMIILGQDEFRQIFWQESSSILPAHSGRVIHYNDARVANANSAVLLTLQHSIGALVFTLCSIGAVLFALWRRFRTSAILIIISALVLFLLAFLSSLSILV